MSLKVIMLFSVLFAAANADAACIARLKHPGRIVVQTCQVVDTIADTYVGVVSRRIEDQRDRAMFIERYTGVIISSADEKFFYHDLSQTTCDSLHAGDIIQASVLRECCDGGGGAPCGLGFDIYISEYAHAE